ncbi:MAG: methyltransferase family protein [Promethearchaeota archaeon]
MLKDAIITKNKIENEVDDRISRQKILFKELIPSLIYWPLLITQIVLVFFLYNYYHLDFLTWIGWVFMAFFIVVGAFPRQAFKRYGKIEVGKSHIYTTKLVDKGIYAIIRHPYWLSWILLSISVTLISQHWLLVIFALFICSIVYGETYILENGLIEKFGNEYREYREKVPRMNLILGFIKYIKRNNKNIK